MKGLVCSVYESKRHGNCSAAGISSRVDSVILCPDPDSGNDWGIPKIFEASDDCPAVVLRSIRVSEEYEHVYAVPVELLQSGTGTWMFGGSFLYTSDSRFPLRHPIPLHDRVEEGRGYGD